MFPSPVVSSLCVGLGVTCTFNIFLTGYNVTVVDGGVSHVGVGMSRLIGCSKQDGPSVVVWDEEIVDVSKAMFDCSLDFSNTY